MTDAFLVADAAVEFHASTFIFQTVYAANAPSTGNLIAILQVGRIPKVYKKKDNVLFGFLLETFLSGCC